MYKRVVAVLLRSLPLEVVFSKMHDNVTSGEFNKIPCAICQKIQGQSTLVMVSESAQRQGIRPGMGEAEAKSILRTLEIQERESSMELTRLEQAADVLFQFSSTIEVCPPATLLMELRGSGRPPHLNEVEFQRILKDFRGLGHEVIVTMADTVDTARTLAEQAIRQGTSPVRCVPPGQNAKALASLPIEALVWFDSREDPSGQRRTRTRDAVEALRAVGMTKVGDVATLPLTEVGTRFGAEGTQLVERARGVRDRALKPHCLKGHIEEEFEFDHLTESIEPILFVLRRLLHRLVLRLSSAKQAVQVLTLSFEVEPGDERILDIGGARARSSRNWVTLEVRMARATRSIKTMLEVIREKLDGTLPGAIWTLKVGVTRSEEHHGTQLDLFSCREQTAESLGALIGRLTASLGEQSVFSPQINSVHRPEEAWTRQSFSVDEALKKIKTQPRTKLRKMSSHAVEEDVALKRMLPSVSEQLSVIHGSGESNEACYEKRSVKSWPASVRQQVEEEVLPVLPARPSLLLEYPEPAIYLRDKSQVRWRGRRMTIRAIKGYEQFRTDWWRSNKDPLERDYMRIETEEGPVLWIYLNPQGKAFVHGVFD